MGRAGQKGGLPRGITIRRFETVERIAVTFQYKGERCRELLEMPPTPANIKWADATLNEIRSKIVRGTFVYAEHFPNSPRAGRAVNTSTVGALLAHERPHHPRIPVEARDREVGRALSQPLSNPSHVCQYAAVSRRQSVEGRRANGARGFGNDLACVWQMDTRSL